MSQLRLLPETGSKRGEQRLAGLTFTLREDEGAALPVSPRELAPIECQERHRGRQTITQVQG